MIRIIFDDGELMECEHINKIYIDAKDTDKICIVGELLDKVYIADQIPKENEDEVLRALNQDPAYFESLVEGGIK